VDFSNAEMSWPWMLLGLPLRSPMLLASLFVLPWMMFSCPSLWLGWFSYNENLDFGVGTPLPVSGAFPWKYSVSIPSIAPSGAYEVDLTFSDQDGMPLTCMQVNFNL